MTPAQAERIRQVQAVQNEFLRLGELHRAEFARSARPVAQSPQLPRFDKLLAAAEKQAFAGIPLFDRERRRVARAAARSRAEGWAGDLMVLAESDRSGRQATIDAHWSALETNQPDVVRRVVTESFHRAGRRIRVTSIEEGDIGLTLTLPALDVVPPGRPSSTVAGAPTLHQLSKTERNVWYAQVVASYVLLAAKEAFAAAPGPVAARVVGTDRAGLSLIGARIERNRMTSVDWREAAWPVLQAVAPTVRVQTRGRARDLVPIDLRDDPVFGPVVSVD